jgi:hypothetical protein
MSNATVTRIGQINAAGAVDALFLKVFAGEVLTAFEEKNVALNYTTVKSISSGKSAQFPYFGKTTAAYHTPGNEILGLGDIKQAEQVISIQDLLISHQFIANIDEAKSHYDARSIYATEMGRALAVQMDKHIFQVALQAARSAAVVTGQSNGGTIIYENSTGAPASADFENNGAHLAAAFFMAAEELDEKDCPEDGRVAFVRPAQYYKLVQSLDNINKDWGGAGAYSDGKIVRIAGIEIVKTNHLPSTNVSTGVGIGSINGSTGALGGDFSNVVGLVMQKTAVGTLKLLDLGMESEYQISRQGTLMVAKYAVGHGVLRPDAAVEIRAAASA